MVVKNEVPFAVPLAVSTATVTITVQDVNEPPVFEPAEKRIMIYEDLEVGSTVSKYTANDPDTAREQTIRFTWILTNKNHIVSFKHFFCVLPCSVFTIKSITTFLFF